VVALDAVTGKQIWKTYTIAETPKQVGKNTNGTLRWAPAGGGVWNSPTIDAKRRRCTSAQGTLTRRRLPRRQIPSWRWDLDTGKILWSVLQDTQDDTWLAGCTGAEDAENCPTKVGPDHDFGAPPILKAPPDGRTLLIAGQKSGNVWRTIPIKGRGGLENATGRQHDGVRRENHLGRRGRRQRTPTLALALEASRRCSCETAKGNGSRRCRPRPQWLRTRARTDH